MVKEFICIVCPKGCHIKVNGDDISGYSCPRGLAYVKQELINPTRTLTSTVKVINSDETFLCPVRSENPIPKDKIFDAMEVLKKIKIEAPIKMHQIIVENILGTGVNIVATKEINK